MINVYKVLLAGNPNVGKSTLFNALTGLRQHTGNWSGKTVETACGSFTCDNVRFEITDLPGMYSTENGTPDECAAAAAFFQGNPDCVIITADASAPRRCMGLVLNILEMTKKCVLCLNLADEAAKKQIFTDTRKLSAQLGIPVICTSARSGEGLELLKKTVLGICSGSIEVCPKAADFPEHIENAVLRAEDIVHSRSMAIHILKSHDRCQAACTSGISSPEDIRRLSCIDSSVSDELEEYYTHRCDRICQLCVKASGNSYSRRDRKLDKILTSKKFGIPVMLLLLSVIFYLTISGANYPSELLSAGFAVLGAWLREILSVLHAHPVVSGLLLDGVYSTLANVISVMLPPMLIFFPLFTLLEDLGYLPRVAFNLDPVFARAGTDGKQALPLMMGFGCNACGVTGCRIIGDRNKRFIAVVTNNFSPCNGRFPMMIAVISSFLTGTLPDSLKGIAGALILTFTIIFGMAVSLLMTRLLASSVFPAKRGEFILELPPYRRPQILRTIFRSICDRTAAILGRAAVVAAPAGAVIWLLANIHWGDNTLIGHIRDFLQPAADLIGLDGAILTGFLLGAPANEIVMPIVMMIYTGAGTTVDSAGLQQMHDLFLLNGWTLRTALCTLLFTLMHFPCTTACVTVYKETKNLKCTLLAIFIPTLCGIVCCFAVSTAFQIFSYFLW